MTYNDRADIILTQVREHMNEMGMGFPTLEPDEKAVLIWAIHEQLHFSHHTHDTEREVTP